MIRYLIINYCYEKLMKMRSYAHKIVSELDESSIVKPRKDATCEELGCSEEALEHLKEFIRDCKKE